MQQKVQFVATVVHGPSLFIFDEPFSGLDPINAELLQDVILQLRDEGRTIVFASHRMEQVEQICDDICLISDGRIVLAGGVREVKRSFGRNVVNLEFDGDANFLRELESQALIRVNALGPHSAEIRLLDAAEPGIVLRAAVAHLNEVYRYEVVEPSLNEIFISVVSASQGDRKPGLHASHSTPSSRGARA
jgi:ABC-2 type transport system ATP-binding protein